MVRVKVSSKRRESAMFGGLAGGGGDFGGEEGGGALGGGLWIWESLKRGFRLWSGMMELLGCATWKGMRTRGFSCGDVDCLRRSSRNSLAC